MIAQTPSEVGVQTKSKWILVPKLGFCDWISKEKTELCSGWNYQLLFLGFGNIWNTFVTRCKFTSWNIGILPPTELYWPLSLGAAAKSKLWTSAGHFLVCCLAKISEACIGCWAVDQNMDNENLFGSTLRTSRWTDRSSNSLEFLHFLRSAQHCGHGDSPEKATLVKHDLADGDTGNASIKKWRIWASKQGHWVGLRWFKHQKMDSSEII